MQPSADFRLSKSEKLCSPTDIDLLFANSGGSQSFIAFPLRVVWRHNTTRRDTSDLNVKFLVSIPKKRLRHAVDRVRMRRLVREAYRLGRSGLALDTPMPLDIAFIYVDSGRHDYATISRAMTKALTRISDAITAAQP